MPNEELAKVSKKEDFNGVNVSKNTIVGLVSGLISQLHDSGLSYQEISYKLDIEKISKANVFMLHKKTWFPKDQNKQSEILEKLTALTNNYQIKQKSENRSERS